MIAPRLPRTWLQLLHPRSPQPARHLRRDRASTCSWYGWTSAGVLTVGRLDLANLDSAVPTIHHRAGDVWRVSSRVRISRCHGARCSSIRIRTRRRSRMFAGTATRQIRAIFSRPYQCASRTTDPAGHHYLGNWWDYHKSAIDSAPIGLAIGTPPMSGSASPAQDVATRSRRSSSPWTRVYRLTVGLEWYDLTRAIAWSSCTALWPRRREERARDLGAPPSPMARATWSGRAERSRLPHLELRMSSARIVPVNFFDSEHSTDRHLAGGRERVPRDEPAVERVERHLGVDVGRESGDHRQLRRQRAADLALLGVAGAAGLPHRRAGAASDVVGRCEDRARARPDLRLLHVQRLTRGARSSGVSSSGAWTTPTAPRAWRRW
jgi:hypothetical protein